MEAFITGVLESNLDGAKEEGIVHTRWLELRHPNGQVLTLFDTSQPIGAGLPTGETYQVVVVPWNAKAKVSEPQAAPAETNEWEGQVVDMSWRAPSNVYRRSRPELFDSEWALLSTRFGNLLMRTTDMDETARARHTLRWSGRRLDLYAVV